MPEDRPLGALTIAQLYSAKTSAHFLLKLGSDHGVLPEALAARLIEWHARVEGEIAARDEDGRPHRPERREHLSGDRSQ